MGTYTYNGAMANSFFVELQYSKKELKFVNSGFGYRDLIAATFLLDRATGRRFWSPILCAATNPEIRAKITWSRGCISRRKARFQRY